MKGQSAPAPAAALVKADILKAFNGTSYPGDEHFAIGSSSYDPEIEELKNAFRGRDWTSISVATVCHFKDALPLFTPAARRYYLPAYLVACLDAYADADTAVDSVIAYLAPPKKPSGKNWDAFKLQAEEFNDAQKRAIGSFLDIMDQHDPGKERLVRALGFWK